MKCYPEKINAFLENEKIDTDIKDFVLALFKNFTSIPKAFMPIGVKISFLALGFYEVEAEDEDELDGDEPVIDFYKLNNLTPSFRMFIIKLINKGFKHEKFSDFANELLGEDLKVIIEYKDWKKMNRKNKLEMLNKINL
jgi:hypothetical protein